jgi:hypothetical protein
LNYDENYDFFNSQRWKKFRLLNFRLEKSHVESCFAVNDIYRRISDIAFAVQRNSKAEKETLFVFQVEANIAIDTLKREEVVVNICKYIVLYKSHI